MSASVVFSVGYERRRVEDLVEILLDHGVDRLLDVREAPVSRRPGFSKRALAERLTEAGIEYRHLRDAGNPHRLMRNDVERCLALYQAHLAENPQVLDLVASELADGATAMLCYEREHSCCHRSILLEALAAHGHNLEVVHVE